MRVLQVIVCLAVGAAPVWAGLDHVQAVTREARSSVTLTRIAAVDSVVPQTVAVPAVNRVRGDEGKSEGSGALEKVAKVEANISGVGCLTRLSSGVAATDLPPFEHLSRTGAVARDVPGALALDGTRPADGGGLPCFRGIGAIAGQQIDPLLTWFDIWSGGALGELRNAAITAVKSGDGAAYRECAARYWAAVAIASERRRVLVVKPGDGASGIRGAKRSGP